jgi:hypothetical protein
VYQVNKVLPDLLALKDQQEAQDHKEFKDLLEYKE